MRSLIVAFGACATLALPNVAHGFCGFYVSGGGADLFNNATQVVLMRAGTRTVLSMQNNYQGPPADFAMVVPVPTVLHKDNVKTLHRSVFDRIDKLSAPRLVEYWEEDPCAPIEMYDEEVEGDAGGFDDDDDDDLGVTIEAKFAVGEYQIVILGARQSTGLETWLRRKRYNIPAGAEPLLRPYVQRGMKFFVAKVDADKVAFRGGMAMLSPLRFHYDAEGFNLPIRLGLMNSAGTQDLIVHILAPGQRYEVANYPNVTIPTNLDVKDAVRTRFGEFYAALFDATLEKNPGAVVTEYAWDATSCDPCPEPPLDTGELASLGADVLGRRGRAQTFVLTRLHARYGKNAAPDDLQFKAAPAISGGGEWRTRDNKLVQGARPSSYNRFQGRYAIRHQWTGPITCEKPTRGRWGGPPSGARASQRGPQAATNLAFAPRGQTPLASMVAEPVAQLAVSPSSQPLPATGTSGNPASGQTGGVQPGPTPGGSPRSARGCGCRAENRGADCGVAVLALVCLLWLRRRTQQSA